ncbi:MAG TPA: ABC transporter ATP-binding protein [Turneriella sp.]|nr:ABC transporter ATP-binding protein [Turneriella sp.]HNA78914.1 ABC transporter ATP-binding protein [Turneriella sp.]HNE20620.1 ABC transporter ATP-binding protein [Turneriella sp.]HNL53775.1 ABC transporter ATP-binding protein [Turneriella sp.]HNM98886.1 ABC transporter ATP-binding protein [Turneriella sp.]
MHAIEIQNLRKTYPLGGSGHGPAGAGFEALKGIDLTVDRGDFFALLGPNGAGKSTLIGILASLVMKSSGSCRIMGVDMDKDMPRAKSFLGLVPQEFNLNIFEPPMQILVNQAGYYGITPKVARTRAEKYLTQLGIMEKALTPTRMLSGGMKRRLMIARALIHEPAILILDEPTAGVDIELRKLIWNFLTELNASGTTIILTTHYLEEAENLCRNIAIIDHGQIIAHTAMKKLLSRLNQQTYVIELVKPLAKAPRLSHFQPVRTDNTTLEITVKRNQPMNALFADFSAKKIGIRSVREKTNRLEQLFLELTGKAGKV